MSYDCIPESLLRDIKCYQRQVATGNIDHLLHEHLVSDIRACVGVPEAEYFDRHRELPYMEGRFSIDLGPLKELQFLGAISGSPHPSTPSEHLRYSAGSVVATVSLAFGLWALAYKSTLFPVITAWEIILLMLVPLGISWVIYLVTKFWFIPKDIDHRLQRVAEFKQLQADYEQQLATKRKNAVAEAEAARRQRLQR
ncbi:hypothetical protein [Glutamicibacter sp. NPDC090743]|uniref:hypothetical protein n=1 Tax=Glutamicibacter sp. NPDC090743 TaxID=3364001 RepID=UPI00381F8B9F